MLRRTIAVLLCTLIPAAATLGAELAPVKSSEGGVTITVTPPDVTADSKVWEFQVALDTHAGSLTDDLAKTAVLVDDQAREFRPTAWEGPGAGGHHRAGILRFDSIAPPPASLELRITRPEEASPRIFRWDLK